MDATYLFLAATLTPIALGLIIQALRRRADAKSKALQERAESKKRVMRAYLDDANSNGSLS